MTCLLKLERCVYLHAYRSSCFQDTLALTSSCMTAASLPCRAVRKATYVLATALAPAAHHHYDAWLYKDEAQRARINPD